MSTILRAAQSSAWSQRLLALVLGCNTILILWGVHVVPADVTLNGVATTAATIGMQAAIAVLVFFGPLSLTRYPASIGTSLVLGLLFAVAYDGILLTDFIPSLNIVNFNVFLLFLGAASLAGFLAGYQTGSFGQGVVAAFWALVIGTAIWSIGLMTLNYAFWGTHHWFFFWKNDGAIDDFHRSGSTNLSLFLLQDMQGALFFHPLLSAVVGTICGLIASGLAQIVLWLQRRLAAHRPAS